MKNEGQLWLWPGLDDVAIAVTGAYLDLAFNRCHGPKGKTP